MTIGQKIRESRKQKGMTLEALAACCGKRKSWLCSVENDALKSGVDPETLIVIADALSDQSILTHALLENPICKRVVPERLSLSIILSPKSLPFLRCLVLSLKRQMSPGGFLPVSSRINALRTSPCLRKC